MALIDDIRRQARAENRLIDSLTDDFARELDDVLAGVDRQIRRLVGTLDSTGGRLVADEAAMGRALGFRTELSAALDAAGWETAATLELDALAAQTLRGRGIAAAAARSTPINVDVVLALQELGGVDLLELGEQVTNTLWRSTLDGVVGARPVADLVDELAEVTNVTRRQARTLHDTAVSTFARQTKQLGLPNEPGDRFLYMGPDDSETRPFCREVLGDPIRTRAEISALSNGQLPNALMTGGGFNCRHTWQYIDDLTEEDLEA